MTTDLLAIDHDWSKLDPELAPYLDLAGPYGLPMLRHPLLYDLGVRSVTQVNTQLAQKRRAVREAAADGDWAHVLWLHERPYRLDALDGVLASGAVAAGSPEHRALLRMVWCDLELPRQFGYRRIVRAFRAAGFVGEGRPERGITVYRGCTSAGKRGVSWTLDSERAAWFARRFKLAGEHVYAAEVPPSGVLAVLDDRGEGEVVVDPRGLRNLRQLPDGD